MIVLFSQFRKKSVKLFCFKNLRLNGHKTFESQTRNYITCFVFRSRFSAFFLSKNHSQDILENQSTQDDVIGGL